MKYIITGEILKTNRMVSPAEFIQILDRGIILHLEAFNRLGLKKKISPNGNSQKRTGVAIVYGDSFKEINHTLKKAPSWFQVKWRVIPLEEF